MAGLDGDTARVVGQLLLIVLVVGLLFVGGAIVLTLGLASQRGKPAQRPGDQAVPKAARDPSEFSRLSWGEPSLPTTDEPPGLPAATPRPETPPPGKKAS